MTLEPQETRKSAPFYTKEQEKVCREEKKCTDKKPESEKSLSGNKKVYRQRFLTAQEIDHIKKLSSQKIGSTGSYYQKAPNKKYPNSKYWYTYKNRSEKYVGKHLPASVKNEARNKDNQANSEEIHELYTKYQQLQSELIQTVELLRIKIGGNT